MKTLLLCGYRTSDHSEDPLGLTRDESGRPLLERRISELKALGHQVVCVLSGQQADEQLRQCRSIISTELVYDTNEEVSLMTNIKAGLAAVPKQAVFILPLEIPCPPREVWQALEDAYRPQIFEKTLNLVQLCDAEGSPLHYGFPLLSTRLGGGSLRDLPNLTGLTDTRLNYLHVAYPPDATLASHAVPA